MTNAEIFARPGEITARFALSLFDKAPTQIDPQMLNMLEIGLSVFIWVQFCRFIFAMVKRLFGFERRGGR